MSEFIKTLQAERARLMPIAEPVELPAALAKQAEAKEAYRAYIETRRGYGGSSDNQGNNLNAAVSAANNAVGDLVHPQERAIARIKEIDRMLAAADDKNRYREALTEKIAHVNEARARLGQFNSIAADLEGEIEALKQKRGDALKDYGKAEMQARLAGKNAAPPKAVAAIDADLESRNAALAAAQAAKEESETVLASFTDEADRIRRQLHDATMRCAEVDYYELLPSFMPIIARLVAGNANLAFTMHGDVFEVRYSPADVAAAEAALNSEIDGAADAGAVSQ